MHGIRGGEKQKLFFRCGGVFLQGARSMEVGNRCTLVRASERVARCGVGVGVGS